MLNEAPQNPFDSISKKRKITKSLFEIPANIPRIRKVLHQLEEIGPLEAQNWLGVVQVALSEQPNPVLPFGDRPIFDRYLGVGHTNTAFRFHTSTGEWVLKVGGEKAHVVGYLDPSTNEFAEWYLHTLNILRDLTKVSLPYLVPEPQIVLFTKIPKPPEAIYPEPGETFRTLIIQPYYSELLGPIAEYHIPLEDQVRLRNELGVFKSVTRALDEDHGLIPDLGGIDNFTVARARDGKLHFIMLDDEMRDRRAPSPLVNLGDSFRRDYKMFRHRRRLDKAIALSMKEQGLR